jgi:hypothetical protein
MDHSLSRDLTALQPLVTPTTRRFEVPISSTLASSSRPALRQYVREGEIETARAALALEDLRALDLQRHAHEPLLERVWALRQNLTAYDAVYVALTEVLDGVASDGVICSQQKVIPSPMIAGNSQSPPPAVSIAPPVSARRASLRSS